VALAIDAGGRSSHRRSIPNTLGKEQRYAVGKYRGGDEVNIDFGLGEPADTNLNHGIAPIRLGNYLRWNPPAPNRPISPIKIK
jgi:hypothetical protein